jgi:hypothetical protein
MSQDKIPSEELIINSESMKGAIGSALDTLKWLVKFCEANVEQAKLPVSPEVIDPRIRVVPATTLIDVHLQLNNLVHDLSRAIARPNDLGEKPPGTTIGYHTHEAPELHGGTRAK